MTMAAAPSLAPAALPAVMLNPSISGCSGFSEASFSRLVSRRGCSSTAKVIVVPSRRFTSRGTISSSKLPASMAATARWCERRAQASISSRVTPALTAAFQPTVMDMSMFGASGLSRWLGDIQSVPVVGAGHPPGRTRRRGLGVGATGDDDAVHAGPDGRRRALHGGQRGGAVPVVGHTGRMDQTRLDGDVAGDVPTAVEALPHHHVVHELRVDARPSDGLASTTRVPSSKASTSTSDPLNAVPIGLRAVETITASCMLELVSVDCCTGTYCRRVGLHRRPPHRHVGSGRWTAYFAVNRRAPSRRMFSPLT